MIFPTPLALLALLPALVLADLRLNETDVPQQCRSICQPVTNLTQTCNLSNSTGNLSMSNRTADLLERQCVCTNESFDVANRTSICAGCLDQNARNSTGSNSTGNNRNSTGQVEISSIMSVCGFMSMTQSFAPNMTSATSANVTATRPTDTAALTTTITTGIAEPSGGWGGGTGPDDTASPDAGTRFGVSSVGVVVAMVAGIMMGM